LVGGDGPLPKSGPDQLCMPCRVCCRKKLLEQTFARFDLDSNGYLTINEASMILREDPFCFPPDKVLGLLKRFDKDGNGKLDYREFAGFYAEARAT